MTESDIVPRRHTSVAAYREVFSQEEAKVESPGESVVAAATKRGNQAKVRLLATAERLLISHGVQGVTTREVTAEAGLSIAMVNYHFGSRDALVKAVLERRLSELNQRRVQRLEELAHRQLAPGLSPTVHTLLTVFLEETCAYCWDGGTVRELLRAVKDPFAADLQQVRQGLLGLHGPVSELLFETLARALPGLDEETLWWRWRVAMGAVEEALEVSPLWSADVAATVAALVKILVPLLTAGVGRAGRPTWLGPSGVSTSGVCGEACQCGSFSNPHT